MFTQPIDFRDESEALCDLIASAGPDVFALRTQFRNWTVEDVLVHLHVWNIAADLSLKDGTAFDAFYSHFRETVESGRSLRKPENSWLDGIRGPTLLRAWREQVETMTARFAAADPRQRLRWAGPDMSARSSITARLMETWAHGQEIYDALAVQRIDADRIRNIAILGVNTFGWSFKLHGIDVPPQAPQVRLTAPSGNTWIWNDATDSDFVEGDATEFCQVVTQTRNVADTKLRVRGEVATLWMSIAQCFAGSAQTPPAPGARRRAERSFADPSIPA